MKHTKSLFLSMIAALGVCCSGLQAAPVLVNGSFTADSHPGDGVSLGNEFEITGWTRSSAAAVGQVVAGQFHHDNGLTDGQAVWMQGNQMISQDISGFEDGKTYEIVVLANARGVTDPPSMQIRLNGVAIAGTQTPVELTPIEAVSSFTLPFPMYSDTVSPGAGTFTLEIEQMNTVGDRSLIIDSVALYETAAGPVVLNGGFEQNNPNGGGSPFGVPDVLGYWIPNNFGYLGNIGNDVSGAAYYDNGINPEGIQVAYLQDGGRKITQSVDGFEAGKRYTLSFSVNARAGNSPELMVTLGGSTIFQETITSVESSGLHSIAFSEYTVNFNSPGDGAFDLAFTQNTSGDNSVLLDNITITEIPNVPVELSSFSLN